MTNSHPRPLPHSSSARGAGGADDGDPTAGGGAPPAPAELDAWELYDVVADPFETTDIAAEAGDAAAALQALRRWVLAGNFTCLCYQC